MFDRTITRFGAQGSNRGGVASDNDTGFFSDLGLPNPTRYHSYLNDFDTYAAGDWTVTKVGTGTVALGAVNNGALVLTNTTGTSDSIAMQLVNASFKLVTGYRCWGKFLGQVSSLLPNLLLGLANTSTTPIAGLTDGIWLSAAAGATTMNIQANSGAVQSVSTGLPVLVAGSQFNFSFYYDGNCYSGPQYGRVMFELSGAGVAVPYRGEIACGSAFPFTTLLAPQIEFQNTTALASVFTLDQLWIIEDRININATPAF